MSTFVEIDNTWDEAGTTQKFGSHKGWHTSSIKEV